MNDFHLSNIYPHHFNGKIILLFINAVYHIYLFNLLLQGNILISLIFFFPLFLPSLPSLLPMSLQASLHMRQCEVTFLEVELLCQIKAPLKKCTLKGHCQMISKKTAFIYFLVLSKHVKLVLSYPHQHCELGGKSLILVSFIV